MITNGCKMNKGTSYTCVICRAVNHITRLHCSICGTTPAEYSWCGKPIRDSETALSGSITVVVAHGAERLDMFRTCKSSMRTVPLDYYAEV